MDMKSYILVGGGLLICLVLLHALVSAWRANRGVPDADGVDVDPEILDQETEDAAPQSYGTEILWDEDAQAEPMVEEFVADAEPGPPVLMESAVATDDDTAAADGVDTDVGSPSPSEPNPAETPIVQTMDTPEPADDGPEGLRKGRRIEIAGKRTEPTVPRAMRPEFHEFILREPSAGEREGLAPRMEEPSAGEREGLAPRMGSLQPGSARGLPLA